MQGMIQRALPTPTAATLCCLVLCQLVPATSVALDRAAESVTGKEFPSQVRFTEHGIEHTLALTGLTVRKRFFLNVYSIAHYMQRAPQGTAQEALHAVMEDNSAKQVTMAFVRDVSAARIRASILDGFRRNATDVEFEQIKSFVQTFTRSLDQDVKRDDQFIIRWLPGGRTVSLFHGREVTRITNETFARVLWSIWVGEQSVVDRDKLVRQLTLNSQVEATTAGHPAFASPAHDMDQLSVRTER